MPYKKYVLVSVILVLALSSCQLPYPDQNSANTPNPTSLFTTPLSAGNDQMTALQGQATQTALALTAAAGNGPTATASATPITGSPLTPVTATPIIVGVTTLTPSLTPIVVGGSTMTPSVTPVPPTVITNRPATYTLQKGEFPYCIARRFDVDPTQLLQLSGLSDGVIYPSGTLLRIPQSGSFPGPRALRTHPATYTVTASDETFYSIACLYGDVDPARIAQANPTYSLGSVLPVGKTINIP
jgi:LysM repeat protein